MKRRQIKSYKKKSFSFFFFPLKHVFDRLNTARRITTLHKIYVCRLALYLQNEGR